MRACPACRTETEDEGRYCPSCGSSLELARRIAEVTTVLPASDRDIGADSTAEANVTEVARTAALVRGSASTSLVGLEIDGFRIDSILGGGAFGTVYRGLQLGLERAVAFKVPTMELAGDAVAARRFQREARAAARVDHPGVVTIYAVGTLDDGRPYLAMQYVDGQALDRIFEREGERLVPLAPVRALKIARQIAAALAETHAMDVVHRDLKPSNIVWRRDRSGDDRITLVDFGIAVCKPGNADVTRLTGANLIGTPHYMAPEQAQGDDVDGRTDLYALGCVLYELVTGATPFDGTGFEVLLAHVNKPIAPPSARRPLPPAVDRVIGQLLAKRPDERPASADAAVALLDEAIAELARGAAPTRPARGRMLAIAAASAVATLAVGYATFRFTRTAAAPAPAIGDPDPGDDTGPRTRELRADDGTFVCRVQLPERLTARTAARARIRVLAKLGQPIDATEVVVTLEDPHGNATGYTARRRVPGDPTAADASPYFAFRHAFPAPGHYVMRIFPPESDSVFRFELDVD